MCYDQSLQRLVHASEPQNHKLINVFACGSVFSHLIREHLQISEGRSSDCSDVISEILVHISDQIGRSSVVYRICGIGIPKGQHPTHVHVSTSTEIRSSS